MTIFDSCPAVSETLLRPNHVTESSYSKHAKVISRFNPAGISRLTDVVSGVIESSMIVSMSGAVMVKEYLSLSSLQA
ncbi:MAG: hypothetical protein CVV44_22755 [Spirochaetae bacterium HGW-Spirochaetae-1]|nr:MAG: hypothetical protein CVV44_22755 [Spirochaetae bacterium HGW-Spirochaetae-1]